MPRRRRSAEQWAKIIERYRRSGLTQREFCEREGVSTGALQHWLYRAPKAKPKFVEVLETSPRAKDRRATVRVRVREIEVDVEAEAVVELVASLLDVLERRGTAR
jgi:transposase-like protein